MIDMNCNLTLPVIVLAMISQQFSSTCRLLDEICDLAQAGAIRQPALQPNEPKDLCPSWNSNQRPSET